MPITLSTACAARAVTGMGDRRAFALRSAEDARRRARRETTDDEGRAPRRAPRVVYVFIILLLGTGLPEGPHLALLHFKSRRDFSSTRHAMPCHTPHVLHVQLCVLTENGSHHTRPRHILQTTHVSCSWLSITCGLGRYGCIVPLLHPPIFSPASVAEAPREMGTERLLL